MNVIKGLTGSRKFWASIGTAFSVLAITLIPALEPMEAHIGEIVATGAAYVVGQGLADFGKEAKK